MKILRKGSEPNFLFHSNLIKFKLNKNKNLARLILKVLAPHTYKNKSQLKREFN